MRIHQIITFSLLLLFSLSGHSQSIHSYVISSAGSFVSDSEGGMYTSLGEPMVTEIADENVKISQGFLQVTVVENSVNVENLWAEPLHVYPNPTLSELTIELSEIKGQYQLDIFDITGRPIRSQVIQDSKSLIEFNDVHQGTYYFKITKDRTSFKTLKVIKL